MTEHVQIRGVSPRIQYTADGESTAFDYPFAIFDNNNLKVYFGSTLQSSGYTVAGSRVSTGGTVTFDTAPTDGTIITLVRDLTIARTSDFQEGGALRANVLNDEFDYQTACQQQIADNLNRSMVLPPYAVNTDVDLTLPAPSAGKSIVWNSTGTNLENSTVEVNTLESTLLGYKTADETASSTATAKATEATTAATTATAKATEATTAATTVTTTMATKANKDMDNLTSTGKNTIIGLCMPDYTAATIISLSSGMTYAVTTPSRFYCGVSNNGQIQIRFNNSSGTILVQFNEPVAQEAVTYFDLDAGESLYVSGFMGNAFLHQYPFKGI